MSQHDLNIANQGFPAFRADLNDALVALGSTNSGATAPATTFANQLWYDTANNILKIRNEDNDAWISIATLDQSTDAVTAIGSLTLADIVSLTGSQTLTNKTLTNPTINGFTSNTAVINIGSGQIYKDANGNLVIGGTTTIGVVNKELSIISSSGGAGLALSDVGASSRFQLIAGAGGANKFGIYDLATGSYRMLIDSTGVIDLPIGQIKFPATQNASSDANTLDDYEEGTFTPTVNFALASVGLTYTSRTGVYTKIGRAVNFKIEITLSNKGSSTGYITIGNLPFTNSSVRSACSVYMTTGLPTGTQIIDTDIYIYKNGGSGNYTNLDSSDVTNSTSFTLSGSYQV